MVLFHNIEWKCSDDGVLYNKMVERDRIFDFLQNLNQDLDVVQGRILGTKPLPNMKQVFAEVRCEETRRKVMSSPMQNSFTEIAVQGFALAANRNEGYNPKGIYEKDKRLWCEHCKKPNHTKDVLGYSWHASRLETTKPKEKKCLSG